MAKPTINWETKTIQYDGLSYHITGSDANQLCIVAENTDHNLKEIATGYTIQGLNRDDCLILDAKAYNTLSSAILEYEEYCSTPDNEDPKKTL